MAWGNGGLFVSNFIAALSGGTAQNLTLTTHKIALFNNSVVPDYSVSAATSAYNTGQWVTANEVSGTNWAAGGLTLATAGSAGSSTAPTLTQAPTGSIMYDMNDVIVASTTFTNAYGCFIYADSQTPKVGLVAVPFGAAYSPTNGTFTISWAASGVFALDVTP